MFAMICAGGVVGISWWMVIDDHPPDLVIDCQLKMNFLDEPQWGLGQVR